MTFTFCLIDCHYKVQDTLTKLQVVMKPYRRRRRLVLVVLERVVQVNRWWLCWVCLFMLFFLQDNHVFQKIQEGTMMNAMHPTNVLFTVPQQAKIGGGG